MAWAPPAHLTLDEKYAPQLQATFTPITWMLKPCASRFRLNPGLEFVIAEAERDAVCDKLSFRWAATVD
jgi:hypothetical protein